MSQRDRILLAVIGTVIAIGGFWMLALSPKLKESKDLESEIGQAQEQLDKATGAAQVTETVKIDYSKTYATFAKLGKAVPVAGSVDDDVPSLLLQLNRGGKVTKTGLRSFEISTEGAGAEGAASTGATAGTPPATPPDGGTPATGTAAAAATPMTLNEVRYKYVYYGDLYDLEDLLHYLTNMVATDGARLKISGRLLAIESLDFTIRKARSANPSLKSEMTIVSYTVPETEDALGGGAPPTADPTAPQTAGDTGSGSTDAVPGAPPQAQPATPPSATVKRP